MPRWNSATIYITIKDKKTNIIFIYRPEKGLYEAFSTVNEKIINYGISTSFFCFSVFYLLFDEDNTIKVRKKRKNINIEVIFL